MVDDGSEMNIRRSSPTLSEADADALLSGRALPGHDDLCDVIGMMQAAAAVPAPTPTPALAAVLDDGFDPLPVVSAASVGRCRRWSARIAVATAVVVTATLGAATANALPAPLQTAVANVVGAVTPWQLPRPPADAGTGSENTDGPSDESRAVPFEQPNRNAETGADEPSGEPADSSPVMPKATPPRPKAPAVVTPPRRPEATTTPTDERDADEPDADEPDADVPESDDTGEPEQSDSGEVEQGDADDRDPLDSEEPELEQDEPETDELDANA